MQRFLRLILLLCLSVGSTTFLSAQVIDTLILQPTEDNSLYEDPNGALSNGSGEQIFAGRTNNGALRRALLRFDIAANIPAGAVITQTELTLTVTKSISGPITQDLHTVSSSWGEGSSDASGEEGAGAPSAFDDATWIHRFHDTTLWATAGGDFAAAASASQSVAGDGPYLWTSATMSVDVQNWLDTPAQNHGWLLKGGEGANGTAKRYASRENATGTDRPSLRIIYEIQCTAPDMPMISANTTISCPGDSVVLLIQQGNLNDAVDWVWYNDNCGGTSVGIGAQIVVAPESATTYFVRGEGGCVSNASCGELLIDVFQPNSSFTQSNDTLFASAGDASFQWFDCQANQAVTGAISNFFVPGTAGDYALIVNENGCIDTSACRAIILNSIANALPLPVQIGPNPVRDRLQLQRNASMETMDVHLFGLDGREWLSDQIAPQADWTASVAQLPTGLYLLHLQSGQDRWTVKLLKE